MDANTMRWFRAFLFATQICVATLDDNKIVGGGFNVKRCKLTHRNRSKRENLYDLTKLDDHHHQACAVVEQLLSLEGSSPDTSLGGVIHKTNEKEKSARQLIESRLRKQTQLTITVQKNQRTPASSNGRLEQQSKKEIS